MYRALLEATAFGTRMIVETFVDSGVPVTELVVAGGLLKNQLLMQIYADAVGLPLSTVPSTQAPALGSAIHAATAAGAFSDVRAAAKQMGRRTRNAYTPIPENVAAYDQLYREYVAAYDWFGRGNEMMRRLRRIGSRETVGAMCMTITSDIDRVIARLRQRGLRPPRAADPLRAGHLDRGQRLRPGARSRPDGDQTLGRRLRLDDRRGHGGVRPARQPRRR